MAAAFVRLLMEGNSLRFAFMGKIGVEWQSPWKFFIGIEGCVCSKPVSMGYLGGSYVGVRL